MKIASYNTFFSDLKARGFEYALAHTAALGFDGVEILHLGGPLYSVDDAKRAKERFDHYGLDVVCYSVGANLTPDRAPQAEADLLQHASLAAALGSPYLHHTLATALKKTADSPSYRDIFGSVLSSSKRVAEYCASLGLTCLYEPQGVYFNGIDGLGCFFEEMKRTHNNVGVCGDMGNPLFVFCDPVALFNRFQNDILHLHAKNYRVLPQRPTDCKSYPLSNGDFLMDTDLQSGAADLRACLSVLEKHPQAISIEKDGTDEEIGGYIAYLRSITV